MSVETVAHHEAGHAIARCSLGLRVYDIVVDADDFGHSDAPIEWSEDFIVVAYCGPLAARKYLSVVGRTDEVGACGDGPNIRRVAKALNCSNARRQELKAVAESIVSEQWEKIERIARIAIERYHPIREDDWNSGNMNTMTCKEIKAVFEDATV